MEPKFENRYIRTEEMIKEWYKAFFFKRPIFIVISCFFVLSFIVVIVSYLIPYWTSQYAGLYVIFGPVFWIITVLRYKKTLKIYAMRDEEISSGKPIEISLSVFDDRIDVCHETLGNKVPYDLSIVKRVMETKNLISLVTKSNLIIVFKKDGFTKGTAEEFMEFANGLCS